MTSVAHTFSNAGEQEQSPQSCSAWASLLAQASRRLHEVSGSTESEFLAIGSQLHDFHGRAGEILQMSNEVVAQVTGEEVIGAIERLHEILRVMDEYLSHADHESEQGSSTFATILGHLDKVGQPLAGFKKINKSLSMLGISTKIESARLGQSAAGFDTLANDVSKLSVQVTEKSNTIMGQKEQLSAAIRQTLLKVVSVAAQQRGDTRSIIGKTNGSLSVLNDINSRCSSAATVISGVSAEVAQSIGEVVTSLQFHDISRQQIEHVQETLDQLSERLTQAAGNEPRDLIADAGDLCELQAAQLEHARSELLGAVESIIGNLRAIVQQESHLSDRTRTIAGVADKVDSSFFADMEGDLSLVSDALTQNAEENRNLTRAMSDVAGTVGKISYFVTDIENIGQEIELIALNAQIKAARTGSEGAALGVLAEAIQRLSHETRVHTTIVSETLRSITTFIDSLCKGVDEDAADMEAEVGTMVADLKQLLESLRLINENLVSLLGRMDREVQSLSSDIEAATGGITVHSTIGRVLAEVIELVNRVIAEVRVIIPAATGAARAERLREVAGRYTMHSERKIHASFAGSAKADSFNHTGKAETSADDLGDNVELF